MKFPANHNALKEMFINAAEPALYDFQGEYIVDMLAYLPSLKRFSHRKLFYKKNGRIFGHNILLNKKWGHFFLEEGVCSELDSIKTVVINYYLKENTFPVRRIRDHIRCIEKEKIYIGRFNYLIMGSPRFIGYFSLEKVL
jgi:hypothetical protein